MARVKRLNCLINIPETARLVVLIGPNGSGKTTLLQNLTEPTYLEARQEFETRVAAQNAAHWNIQKAEFQRTQAAAYQAAQEAARQAQQRGPHFPFTRPYIPSPHRSQRWTHQGPYSQLGQIQAPNESAVEPQRIEMYPTTARAAVAPSVKFYGRSVYRIGQLIASQLELADQLSRNLNRIFETAKKTALHSPQTVKQAATEALEGVRKIFCELFPRLDVIVSATNDSSPVLHFLQSGQEYTYDCLSAGEKSIFELILDLIVNSVTDAEAVYWIDEPELHIHAELQGRLLDKLYHLIPPSSQLWIATQSIGLIRRAIDIYKHSAQDVAFFELSAPRIAQPISPSRVDREFFHRVFSVALHDLAGLLAPSRVIICEGRPLDDIGATRSEFDARVYDTIFSASHPETRFVSGGSSNDVKLDAIRLKDALCKIIQGVEVCQLIDRDHQSENELATRRSPKNRILSRYSLENYLWDDEILRRLIASKALETESEQMIFKEKDLLLQRATGTPDHPNDPVKKIAGQLYVKLQKISALRGQGSTVHEFSITVLAPLVTPDTETYKDLERDIFGVPVSKASTC